MTLTIPASFNWRCGLSSSLYSKCLGTQHGCANLGRLKVGLYPDNGPKSYGGFNLKAFDIHVPDGQHGNVGRNTILGPGLHNLDLEPHRELQITESERRELHAEFLDFPNHPNWDLFKDSTHYDHSSLLGKILSS